MKFLSALVTIARGSLGGMTATANKYQSLILRAKSSPTNPNSDLQVLSRSAFAEAGAKWTELSNAEREAWKDYAASTVYTGPTGDYTLTGRLAFIASQQFTTYLENIGGSSAVSVPAAPLTPGFLNMGPVSLVDITGPSQTGFGIVVENASTEDIAVLVQVSPAFAPTRNSSPGIWDSGLTQGLDVSAETSGLLEISGLEVDLAYFVKVRGVTFTTENRISNDWTLRRIANAVGP